MDHDEFTAMYERSVRRLIGVTYAACGNLEEAQDCVHEAFARAWTGRSQLDAARSPEAWVQVTALRLAVSRWRRMRVFDRVITRAGPPPSPGPPDEAHVDVVRAMRRLPARTRLVVALHYLCDQPVTQIAEELDMPPNTVKSHLLRGRTALRTDLDPATVTEGYRHA